MQEQDSKIDFVDAEEENSEFTRRGFLGKSAATAAAATLAGGVIGSVSNASAAQGSRLAVPGSNSVVPLPSAKQVRKDYQTMVDFGPRLPGYTEHSDFCDWIEEEFVEAGLQLLPNGEFPYRRWRPGAMSLEVDGTEYDPPAFFVRCPGTPAEGVTGPLVLQGDGSADGSILLVELAVPPAGFIAGGLIAMSSYWQWDGHALPEAMNEEFGRFAMSPWPVDLKSYADQGAKAVVFIVNSGREQLEGNYSPHQSKEQPLPALVVDRDTGAQLKAQAATQPSARLKFEASWKDTSVRQITAILPGESDEVVIINSHTDGQNAFEENGAVAMVHLARHFASLRGKAKLKRTLVFVAWPGHMADVRDIPGDPNVLPEQYGWIPAHRDLFDKTVAAVTIEHLGATNWTETPEDGYHPTGMEEFYAIWTTQGPMQQLCQEALRKSDLQRHALLKPPIQITPGIAWHRNGIPHAAGIAAPKYLLVVSENGEMDKLDANLAARQTALYADMVRRLDTADAAALRTGDPTLGGWAIREDASIRARSGRQRQFVVDAGKGRRLAVRVDGRRSRARDVAVTLRALDAPLSGIVVEVYRGDTLFGTSRPVKADRKARQVLVHRKGHRPDHRNLHRARGQKKFRADTYTVVIRRGKEVLQERNVRFVEA